MLNLIMFRKDNDKKWNRRKIAKLCPLPFHLSQSSRSQNSTKTLNAFFVNYVEKQMAL